MYKYLCLFERKYIDFDWDGVDFAFVYADDSDSAAKKFIKYLQESGEDSYVEDYHWEYVITSLAKDIDVFNAPKESGKFKSNYRIPLEGRF